MDEDEATTTLTAQKFNVDIKREYNSNYGYGAVFSQDPSASSTVQKARRLRSTSARAKIRFPFRELSD